MSRKPVTRFLLELTTVLGTNSVSIRIATSHETCITEMCIKLCMGKVYRTDVWKVCFL
jgi:hypothetical protein